ncbi:class I SAM-dependent methyltransferase [Bordetella bronchialis]|uniref:class I SAM-dependent methyltransferase n=1 Tax=Bordetella bronchialis TaxID=463025 RepID=UPI003D00A05F
MASQLPVVGRLIRERNGIGAAFDSLHAKHAALAAHHEQVLREHELAARSGYCHACRRETTFTIRKPWLRDHYLCDICQSIPRQRHLLHILDRLYPGWETKDIHESSPSNGFVAQWCKFYTSSQYFPDAAPGSAVGGVLCQNLEQLTFPDGSFDIFITQDVMEHVFHPDRALREIMRVLRPGGIHIFTAPKHKGKPASYPRARLRDDGEVEYLLDAEYHGNPVGDGRALVTWDYGDDFEFLASQWAGAPTIAYVTRDRKLGIDGEYLEVFVTRKP